MKRRKFKSRRKGKRRSVSKPKLRQRVGIRM